MSAFSIEEVRKIAKLASLALTPEEEQEFTRQFGGAQLACGGLFENGDVAWNIDGRTISGERRARVAAGNSKSSVLAISEKLGYGERSEPILVGAGGIAAFEFEEEIFYADSRADLPRLHQRGIALAQTDAVQLVQGWQ